MGFFTPRCTLIGFKKKKKKNPPKRAQLATSDSRYRESYVLGQRWPGARKQYSAVWRLRDVLPQVLSLIDRVA